MIYLFILIYICSILIFRNGMMAIAEGRKTFYILGLIPAINTLFVILAYFFYAIYPLFEILWNEIKDLFSSYKNFIHPWRWYAKGILLFRYPVTEQQAYRSKDYYAEEEVFKKDFDGI